MHFFKIILTLIFLFLQLLWNVDLKQEKMKLKLVQKNFKHQMLLGCSGSRRLGRNQRKKKLVEIKIPKKLTALSLSS